MNNSFLFQNILLDTLLNFKMKNYIRCKHTDFDIVLNIANETQHGLHPPVNFVVLSSISLALTQSAPVTLASLLFFKHDKHNLDSELLLHLLFPIASIPFLMSTWLASSP